MDNLLNTRIQRICRIIAGVEIEKTPKIIVPPLPPKPGNFKILALADRVKVRLSGDQYYGAVTPDSFIEKINEAKRVYASRFPEATEPMFSLSEWALVGELYAPGYWEEKLKYEESVRLYDQQVREHHQAIEDKAQRANHFRLATAKAKDDATHSHSPEKAYEIILAWLNSWAPTKEG
jgi:hypothetical protein